MLGRAAIFVASGALVACSSADGAPTTATPASDGGAPGDDATPSSDAGSASDSTTPDKPARTRYLDGPLHSPMTDAVVARAQAVLAKSSGRKDVFAKVGDSITVATTFLQCFAGADVQLDAHADLEPARAFFAKTLADGSKTSFDRTSLAATVGWSADDALVGSPTPIAKEVAAVQPAFAVVMFGTNDNYPTNVVPFERNLQGVVHALLDLGVVPLVSTIPPRSDAAANALVPEMNTVIRAVAQANQLPLMDYHQTLVSLPAYGLAADGIHPSPYVSGAVHACWLTPPALQHGSNQRNLVTLEALDRAKRFLLDAAPTEPAPPALAGAGSLADPWIVDALPFVDDGDTRGAGASLAGYSCGTQDESGPERVYRVAVTKPTKLRARVYADPGVDVDVYLLSSASAASCVGRGDNTVEAAVPAGTYFVVVDSFVTAGAPKAGAYRTTIIEAP